MNDTELTETVLTMKRDGFSYAETAAYLHLSKPTIRRIFLTGKIPPCAKKILEPSAKLKATRERRKELNRIAREWKYANWSAYETACIRNYDEDGLI